MRTSSAALDALIMHLRERPEPLARFCINVPPVPATRPRVSRWGTYYAPTYKNWIKAADAALKEISSAVSAGPVVAVIEHIVARPKTTKRDYPRGDVDNYVKATLDAITKREICWRDDDQVVALVSTKRYAGKGETPHTEVFVYEVGSSPPC